MISKQKQKEIALERIDVLFKEAKKEFKKSPAMSNKYVALARKLSMKYKVKLPNHYKKRLCKKCYKYLVPGKTLRVRTKNKKLIYFCGYCNHITRYPIKN